MMFDNIMGLYGGSRSYGWVALPIFYTLAYSFIIAALWMASGFSIPLLPALLVLAAAFAAHAFSARRERARISPRMMSRLLLVSAFSVIVCLTYLILLPR